jgi:hypothetical protein
VRLTRRDWWGGGIVVASLLGLLAYRAIFIEPRVWGVTCAIASPPLACVPREALLWLQYQGVWGVVALFVGVLALLFGPFSLSVAAVVFGVAGVVNYNATFGMLGVALGAWAWLTNDPAPAVRRTGATVERPGSARTPSTQAPAG